jgi:phage portal protein BeeE
MPGQRVGLSPVAYAAATLGIDIYSRSFASSFFSDGAHPSSILSTDMPVNQDQARRSRSGSSLRSRAASRRSSAPV